MCSNCDGQPESEKSICEDCGHPIRSHGKEGCEVELGDAWVEGTNCGGYVAQGPCGCQAYECEVEEVFVGPVFVCDCVEDMTKIYGGHRCDCPNAIPF